MGTVYLVADYSELHGSRCPQCGDTLGPASADSPTWSDRHDNVVCFDCATGGE